MTAPVHKGVGPEMILVANAGSSSLKFALHPVVNAEVGPAALAGVVEGLEPGGQAQLLIRREQAPTSTLPLPKDECARGFDGALQAALRALQDGESFQLKAVAHRVVHGGSGYSRSVRVDDAVLSDLAALAPLAPLHQPHNLAVLHSLRTALPQVPQVACFDTGFHAHMDVLEQRFALPETYWARGIRRYGFHGLSYRSVLHQLAPLSERAGARVLMAHLGNGASLCAAREGRSLASTMGFSALDGLMMGTRCGSLDAGVVLHLLRSGLPLDAVEDLLYRRSGLLGVSGQAADMRRLRASDTASAQLAIDLFTHRVVREAGALSACLGGLDLLSFSGGIGEHDAVLRQDVCTALGYLGVRLDAHANAQADGSRPTALHAADSAVEIWVVPSDEGLIAAIDAQALLTAAAEPKGRSSQP